MLLGNFKTFFNGKKIPRISPILYENKFVSDFQVKSEMCNSHYAKQCSLLKNESRIPPQLLPHTNTCLSTVRFSENGMLKVIRKLDPSKAHDHDKISIHMPKLSDKAICKTLLMIWSNGLVVKMLDSQSGGPVFKTTGWLQGRLSLLSFRRR